MEKRKIKYTIIGALIIVIGILSFFVYQSYAYFKVNYTGNIINTTVGVFETCKACGILRVSESRPTETGNFLNGPGTVRRNNIESIKFVDHKTVPGTARYSWDVSVAGDNSVIAWYEDRYNDSKYEVTIGSIGGVKANENSSYLFNNIVNLDSIDLTHFYTYEVTNMEKMFNSTGRLSPVFTLNLGNNFDTSKVTNMDAMFTSVGYNSKRFTLDLGDKFDTSNVTNMSTMFSSVGWNSIVFTLDLGDKFDTNNVTNMEGIFSSTGYSSSVFTLDLGDKFDTSNATGYMNWMFSNTGYSSPIFTLDLGNKFDTSNVRVMYSMFENTGYSSPIFTLNLGNKFDTSNVIDMHNMFSGVGYSNTSFTLNLGNNFNTSKVTNMESMFSNVGYNNSAFRLSLGNKFDTSKVTNMVSMFWFTGYSSPIFRLDLRNFNVDSVTMTNGGIFYTNNTSHKIYASASNISFISYGKGFTGTIINCTTSPASCPQ